MKPEEFEVYVIPPNFMEGGTLFGGLLKTRNTIEAVILGLAVGVPVLHLPFSLTVRVVILCLTALPLVLLALIGVSGMSLSAFIRLFFCFLHNRRILSRNGTQGGKNGKTLLPSWAQQKKSDCEAEDPPLPKSRSRFSVDLKQRSVTQFKTFLQEEEAVQPLNALADYIPIEKIEHGVIYTRDHRYCCRPYRSSVHGSKVSEIGFIGMEDDFKLCKLAFLYAYDCIASRCRQIRTQKGYPAKTLREMCNSYGWGFCRGLSAAFQKQEAEHQEWGLVMVVPQAVEDAVSKMKRSSYKISSTSSMNRQYAAMGYADGQEFDMRRRLEPSA